MFSRSIIIESCTENDLMCKVLTRLHLIHG
jgi:hypothetical protein